MGSEMCIRDRVAGCEIVTRVVAAMVEKLGAVILEIVVLVVTLVVVANCVVVVGTVEIGMVLTKENMVFVYIVDNIVVSIVGNVLDIGTRKERIDVGVEVVVGVVDVVVVGGVVVERMLGLDTRKVVQTGFVVRLFVVRLDAMEEYLLRILLQCQLLRFG